MSLAANKKLEEAAQAKYIAAAVEQDVALVTKLGLFPTKDGNQWCYTYGKYPEGIMGFGDTLASAARDFTAKFYNEKA